MKQYYPIALDVEGKKCLVVGGGQEAVQKTARLLEAGAIVTVVSPEVAPTLVAWEQEGRITLWRRAFRPEDTEGVFLVQNCVKGNSEFSARLYTLAQEKGFLVGAWDQPEFSTHITPAVVRRGRLCLAITTGGASPSLAALLRRDLERLFDEEFEAYLEWLAERRRSLAQEEPNAERRATLNRQNVDGFRLEGRITYPAAYRGRRHRVHKGA